MIQVYEATDTGRIRPSNEDSVAVFEPLVFVVADGMGGEAAGEVASKMLTDFVRDQLEGKNAISEADLKQAILGANQAILASASANAAYRGMGTTATILHIGSYEQSACWAHVGDSRLYVIRNGKKELEQVTKDHSYVEELVEQGSITAEEARNHPQRNLLLRAVGVNGELKVDTGYLDVKAGDVFLLATDGLMKLVSDSQIAEVLLNPAQGNPAQKLVDLALNAGGLDNITAVVVVCSQ